MNYTTLAEMTAARGRKKLANNTYAEKREDGKIAIRLHETDILTYDKDGSVVVDTGGWKTVTTKARLNEYLDNGYSLYQKKGQWYWRDGTFYTDGDTIVSTGDGATRLVTQAPLDSEKKAKEMQKRILAYSKLYKAPLDPPSGGDCWYCHLQGQNGKTIGDAFKDTDHLMAHIKEGYVVPSLAYQALKEAGNSDMMISAAFSKEKEDVGFWREAVNERLPKAVAKYMRRRLGLVG